jgi:CelD/BcsL family acetyltransferase involved in cellulose biosynthesis
VKASVVRPHELGIPELAAWRAMQRSSPELANPFLSPGFTLAAGRERPGARVAILYEGQDVVGFFPFEHGPFRTGKPIGAGISDSQAVIHVPALEWSLPELLKCCHLDIWEFDHLVGAQIASAGQNVARRSSPVIDLSNGYRSHAAERQRASKNVIKSTVYKGRKLERDLGGTFFAYETRDPQALTTLLRWKSDQYRRSGGRGRFVGGWIERLVRGLFESRSIGCTGVLSALYSGEEMIAAHFGLRSDLGLACWLPAYDPSLARYSPGLLLHLRMADAAATAGLRYVDLGKGDEVYKQSLKTGDLTVGEGSVHRRSVGAFVQTARRAPGRSASRVVVTLRASGLRRAER